MKDMRKGNYPDNSQEPGQFGGNGLINGKFKSYEDLENAYLNAQKKLTEIFQRLAEIQKSDAGQQNAGLSVNTKQDSSTDNLQKQKDLLKKYLPYCKNKNAKSLQEFVAGLPKQQAESFLSEVKALKNSQNADSSGVNSGDAIVKLADQAFKEFELNNNEELSKPFKQIAYEFYKSFGNFSPEQARQVLEITDKVISAYEDEKLMQEEFSNENNLAKSKLTSSSSLSSGPSADSKHVYTRAEIKEMMKTPAGREKFLKVEKQIFDQMAKGLIK